MEIVKTSLESSQLVNVVDSMFTAAGFGDKRELSFEDFLLLMAEHRENFSDASLNTKGTDNNMNPLSILITLWNLCQWNIDLKRIWNFWVAWP